jgi:hypothetical protein
VKLILKHVCLTANFRKVTVGFGHPGGGFLTQDFVVSRRDEQLRFRAQQRIVATVDDSLLRTEMENLESQEEDAPRRVLWFKPMI